MGAFPTPARRAIASKLKPDHPASEYSPRAAVKTRLSSCGSLGRPGRPGAWATTVALIAASLPAPAPEGQRGPAPRAPSALKTPAFRIMRAPSAAGYRYALRATARRAAAQRSHVRRSGFAGLPRGGPGGLRQPILGVDQVTVAEH